MTTLSLTITTTHTISGNPADALRRDLTQAAIHYGVAPDREPAYRLGRGAVLFGRDWLADGRQITTCAIEDVDAATVRKVAGALMRTWARIVAQHCGAEAVVEFGGVLAVMPAERVAA